MSDDFHTITYGNIMYAQFSDNDIFYSEDLESEKYGRTLDLSDVLLTEEQKSIIESIELDFTANGNVVWLI